MIALSRGAGGTAIVLLALLAGCSAALQEWQAAREADTVEAYRAFLQNHPKDKRARLALWEIAKRTNTVEAYQELLSVHPASAISDTARWRIATSQNTVEGYNKYLRNEYTRFYPPGFVDAANWRIALLKGTDQDLRRYLQRFPEGDHVEEALVQVDWLETRSIDTSAAYEYFAKQHADSDLAATARVEADWGRTRGTDTPAAYRSFLERHPDADESHLVHARWSLARLGNTIEAYEQFLSQNPEGEEADSAREAMTRLREPGDWETAKGKNTIAAYEAFIEAYPGGRYSADAEAMLLKLYAPYESQDWATAQEEDSSTAYDEFLRKHPSGPLAQQAWRRIGGLVWDGLEITVDPVRTWDQYDGKHPSATGHCHWVAGMPCAAKVSPYDHRSKKAPMGRYWEVTAWFHNTTEEPKLIYLNREEGKRGLDLGLITRGRTEIHPRAFRIPATSGISMPAGFGSGSMEMIGGTISVTRKGAPVGDDAYSAWTQEIADISLYDSFDGRLGFNLASGKRTWVLAVFDVPKRQTPVELRVGRLAPVPFTLE